MPTDKIKDVYDLISDKGYFTDENEFRSYVNDPKKIKEVYTLIQDDGFFKDEKEFEGYFSDVKKKEPSTSLGYEKPSEALRMGGLPKQEKLSQSPLKTAETTTPSVSIKRPSLEFTTEKPASTFAVDNKDLALTVGSREARKQLLGQVRDGILGVVEKYPETYLSQKEKTTLYGEKKIPAGTPNVENISKAVDEYAEKIKRESGRELDDYGKEFILKSVVESLAEKKTVGQAAARVDIDLVKEKKLPMYALTGIKSPKGEVVKESIFNEEIKQAALEKEKVLSNFQKTPNKKLDAEFAPELNTFKAEVKLESSILNNQIQSEYKQEFDAALAPLQLQYQVLVDSRQMTPEQANAEFKQKQEQISGEIQQNLNLKFKPEFDALNNKASVKTKEIQTRYNRKYQAEFDRLQEQQNDKIKAVQKKYDGIVSKEYFDEYSARLGQKIGEVKSENLQKELANFRNLPTKAKLEKALMAGWNDVLSTVGGAIGYTGLDASEINKAALQTGLYNPLPAAAFENMSLRDMLTDSDWWIVNGVRSVPFTVVTMPVGIGGGILSGTLAKALGAAKRAQVISSVVGGGVIGWEAERFLETGIAFKEAIDAGKSVGEASEIAASSANLQFATLPLNIAQMLPFFGKGFKFLNSSLLEGFSGGIEEIIQGWAGQRAKNLQEGTEQNGFGQAVNSFGNYFFSKPAMQEGAIGFAVGQTMAVGSMLNTTPDIDKQIQTIMSSLAVGGETQARKVLDLMKKNGAISDVEFTEYNSLIDYTLEGIASTETIPVSDDIKASLVNKYVGIFKARALMTEDENDLASQAAKELIAEKEKEIKEILKGTAPVYLIFPQGSDIPIVSTKEQVEQILLKNPNALNLFDIKSMNDQVTQAKIDEAKDVLNKKQQTEETTTDGEGTIERAVSAGTNVAEEGLGVANEPSSEGVTGEGVQAETVSQVPVTEVTAPAIEATPTAGSVGVGGDVIFQGKRGQADSITFDGKTIKQGEEIELNDVNISQDDSMPDLRSGKYKVRMLSVDANGKTATLTLTDGNEVITTTVKDLRKSEQSLKETPTTEAAQTTKPLAEQIADLRAAEKAEYDAIDPNDKVEREKIYNKYDKLITPLLEEQKATEAAKVEPVKEDIEVVEEEQYEPITVGDTSHDAFTRDNAVDYEEDEKEGDNGRTYTYLSSVTVELVDDVSGETIGRMSKLKSEDGEITYSAEDIDGNQVAEEVATKAEAQRAIVDQWNKQQEKEFKKEKAKEAKEKAKEAAAAKKKAEKEAEKAAAKAAKEATKTEAKKSKPEQIGDGLLDALGLAPVEPAKKAGKAKPVNVSNKSELAELEDQAEGDKKTIIEAAKKGIATLRSVFPDMEIYIHEDTESYNETMSEVGGVANSRGNFAFERDANDNPTGRGRIDINLSNAKDTTVAHELVHAVLLKAFGDNPAVFKAFRDRMSTILRADLNEQVTAFEKLYAGQDVAPEEYLTELAALLSQGGETVEYKPSTLRRVAALINEFVSRITKGKFQPFKSEVDFKNFVDFLNQVAGAISEGGVIDDTDVLNGGGEVGTFNFTSKGQLKAPKASEDSRDFIRKLVEDVDIREFNGKKFVTNMYDYTTAGVADLGNGFEINMLGGKNYVPYMMSKKNKAIGDVSNLAAFNTKGQAESFVRNAKKGKAELFAPHSGTLSASWHFQQHTFAELVNLLLDKGIMNNAELINTFNKTIESSQANQKAFEAFKNKYKENIQNFDSFKSDPKEIVKLLDIQNNYSPDLRKALNNAISADKTFQKAIGVKNKEEFFNKIIDPLNKGVKGGELINVVKFDPNTFEIVQTKPNAIDHHPSFGWTLLAKINGIYQPTEFHKSSEVTNSYTKYNKGGASVSRKATEPSYEKTNVSSSAGAIPKIAKLEVEDAASAISEYNEAPPAKKQNLKSKAQVAVSEETGFVPVSFWVEQLKGNVEYLNDVIKHILDARQELKDGKVTEDKVVKSYLITLASMGSGGGWYSSWNDKTNQTISDIFLEKKNGRDWIRPEGAAAAYLVTPEGKKLVKDIIAGNATQEQVKDLFSYVGFGRENSKAAYVVKTISSNGIKAMTDLFNKNKGRDFAELYQGAMNLEGIGEGKTGFFNQYFGVSERGVIDARELNAWVAGSMKLTPEQKEKVKKAASSKKLGDQLLGYIEQVGIELGYPKDLAGYIAHHAIWDGIANSVTTHAGEYSVVSKSQKAQTDKIKEFIDAQRKSGQSEKDIKAGLELVADKVGLTAEDINNLMGVESDEAKPLKGFKPKEKPTEEPEGEKTGTRAFATKSFERAGVPIEDIPNALKSYVPTSVEKEEKIAEDFIRKHGIDNTINQLKFEKSGIHPKNKPVLARVLLNILYAEQNAELAKNTTDEAVLEKIAKDVYDVIDSTLTAATEAAQFLSLMRDFYNSNPYNFLMQVTRLIEKNINDPIKADVSEAVVIINNANQAAAGQVASNVVKEVVTPKVTSAKEKFERSKANLKALWKKSFNVGISANQYEAAKNDIQFAKALTIMAKDFVVYQSVQFSEFLKEVASQIGLLESDIDQDHLRKIFEKAKSEQIQAGIKVGLKELELKLKDLIESHYSSNEIEEKLIDKLKKEFGIGSDFGFNDAAIKELEAAIKREIKVLTAKEKIKALNAAGIKGKQDIDLILGFSEEGLLEDSVILEKLGEKLGIKKLTAAEAKKLGDIAKDINDSKEDVVKARNVQRFEDFKFVLSKKYNITDFLISNYLTNIFGSLASNLKNIASNVTETSGLVGELLGNALISGNPKDVQRALQALTEGSIRGFDFTKEVLSTGVASYRDLSQIRARGMWELIMDREFDLTNTEKFLQFMFKNIPYLGPTALAERRIWNRFLLAGDAFSSTTNSEIGSLIAATREADKRRLRGNERTNFIAEQMANSPAAKAEAREYALSLGYKEGTKAFRRAMSNYLVSKRPEAIKRFAAEYSGRATLTQQPPTDTFTGLVASILNDITAKKPILKLYLPVVNTFANLIIKNLERSPFEFLLLGFDYARKDIKTQEGAKAGLTKEQVARRVKTATVFTAIGVLLFIATGGTGDDEEGVQIYGSGTGDPALDKARRDLGWRPNTIRFSKDGGYFNFEYLPIGFLLGMVGNMRDYFRYRNKPVFKVRQAQSKRLFDKNLDELTESERTALEIELTMSGNYNLPNEENKEIANMAQELALSPVTYSFQLLKSLGELVNGLSDGAGFIKTGLRSGANIARGVAAPRYLGEVRDIFDNNLYDSKEFRNVIGANIPFITLGGVKLDAFGREIKKYQAESMFSGLKYMITRGFYNPPVINEIDQFLWENRIAVSVPSNPASVNYTDEVLRDYIVLRGSLLLDKIGKAMNERKFTDKKTNLQFTPQQTLDIINDYIRESNEEAQKTIDKQLGKAKKL